MGRVMQITCDKCKREITAGQSYTTITIRRYTGGKRNEAIRLPSLWVCDKCYKSIGMYMSFPPYDLLDNYDMPEKEEP